MPLSEHEQRVLEQIERALYADDPKFAAAVRGIDPRTLHRRRYLRAVAAGLIGVVLLPVGIAVQQIEISVGGFVVMLLAFLYGAATWRQSREAPTPATVAAPAPTVDGPILRRGKKPKGTPAAKRSFFQRIEARWDHRRDSLGRGDGSNDRTD